MKVKAIFPDQVTGAGDDILMDVEVEITVAKINCWLQRARKFPVIIPIQLVATEPFMPHSLAYNIATTVLNRFRDAGWVVRISNNPKLTGVGFTVYVFEPK